MCVFLETEGFLGDIMHILLFSEFMTSCRNKYFQPHRVVAKVMLISVKLFIMVPGIRGVQQILFKMFCPIHYPKKVDGQGSFSPSQFKNFPSQIAAF